MSKELIELYSKLSNDDKRNEFSSLLLKVDSLLNELISQNKIPQMKEIKNYDIVKCNLMSESELLVFFYEDLWIIKNKILALLISNNKGDGNDK